MPSIDYGGKFFVVARSTAKRSRAAIRFPIKASRLSTARRFADRQVLDLLPGWTCGPVRLMRGQKCVDAWVLRRDPRGNP